MEDVRAVLDDVGTAEAALLGVSSSTGPHAGFGAAARSSIPCAA